ncbi:hypothetical protein [Sulfolobus spindle-shaped virus]|nr:hypothetical protein [Sulfolobus spindle-shaped virus]
MIAELLAFYGMHFNDYFTTVLGLRIEGVREVNAIARKFIETPLRLAFYKFSLATLLLIVILIFHIAPTSMIYYDSVIEAFVVCWNTLTIRRHKRARKK